jgi:CMP-N,N'-diacetyllegionaminic acid synthase
VGNTHQTVAIIPARGGSRSIPSKNIVELAGKPLIAWTIECARSCRLLDRVIVSTDSEEIAQIARQYGAEVPFLRPFALAQDDTPMLPVLQHVITAMETDGKVIDIVVLLQPTSPLRSVADIEACILPVKAGLASASMTVCEVEHDPFSYMGRVVNDRWEPLYPQQHSAFTHRQNLPVIYRETGSVLVYCRTGLMSQGTLFPPDIRPIAIPRSRSIDIDSAIDLQIAEVLLK